MNYKQFSQLLKRDGYCWHCGREDDTLIIQHRSNKGFGGSKRLDNAANLIILCSAFNNLIESDAKAAGMALRYGWKLSRYDRATDKPVYNIVENKWYFLLDDFTRQVVVE